MVRSEKPGSESPRKLLNAIPGIQIVEMKHNRERALCCGGSAMAAIGKPGVDFRTQRLQQAAQTDAQIFRRPCGQKTTNYTPKINVPYVYFLVAGAKIKTRGIWQVGFYSRKVGLYGGINLFKP